MPQQIHLPVPEKELNVTMEKHIWIRPLAAMGPRVPMSMIIQIHIAQMRLGRQNALTENRNLAQSAGMAPLLMVLVLLQILQSHAAGQPPAL
jgi:hypothetical protein